MKLLLPSRRLPATLALGASLILSIVLPGLAGAKPWWLRGVESNESDFLPPDVAFRVTSRVEGNQLRVRFVIADGYYLYRQRMEIKAESPDLTLSEPIYPSGTLKTDPYLGTQEIFHQQVEAAVPYTRSDAGAHPLEIKVTYQGCAEAGLCYPPNSKVMFADGGPAAQAAQAGQAGQAGQIIAPPGTQSHGWEGAAIIGGAGAFLFAGFLLRKGRHLDKPAA